MKLYRILVPSNGWSAQDIFINKQEAIKQAKNFKSQIHRNILINVYRWSEKLNVFVHCDNIAI